MFEAVWIVIGIVAIWTIVKRKQKRKSNGLNRPVDNKS